MEPNRYFHQLPANHQRVIAREIIRKGNAEEVIARALTACSVLVHGINDHGGLVLPPKQPFPVPTRDPHWDEIGEATIDAGYALMSAGLNEKPNTFSAHESTRTQP